MEDHFEEWYKNESELTDHLPPLNIFNELTLTMCYGMYEDFLNRRGLKISMKNTPNEMTFYIYYKGMTFYIDDAQTLTEAHISAIKKSNTVYNEWFNK